MNKNICFFNSCKVWGGGEKWHYDTAIKLSQRGYNISFFANPKSKLFNKLQDKNINIYPIKIGNISFLNIFKIKKIINILKKEDINIIILNLPSDLKIAGVAAKIAGIERIIYRRGSAIPIKNSLSNRLLLKDCVTDILANSKTTKDTILKNTKNWLDKDKIKIIYNGIDLDKMDKKEWDYIYKRDKDEIIIGNAGRLSKQKGQKYLIDIAEKLKKTEVKFKIVIAGTGELEKELKEYAKKKHVEDKVVFLGFVKNIKSFMKSIDIFVLTSLWEGFGYVMIEAMANQKPVLAFNVSNISEIVDNKKNGYLISDFDIKEMCDKIQIMYKNKKIMETMGIEGQKRVEEKFDINIAIDKLEDFLNN
ncbi:MAG: glycosyltransferase [Fusobacteriota bacterium]